MGYNLEIGPDLAMEPIEMKDTPENSTINSPKQEKLILKSEGIKIVKFDAEGSRIEGDGQECRVCGSTQFFNGSCVECHGH